MAIKARQYNFLFEHTTVVPFHEIQILEEGKTPDGNPKISYRCRLQESGVKNNNRRIYDEVVCESIVNQLGPRAQARSLLMEVDHPMFFSGATDPVKAKQRATIVEINNCGAILRNIAYRNGQIIGEMETLSGFKGPDLANLITKDKVNIGFSLRALGGVEPLTDGTLKVKTPIMPITYDVVSNPSHQNARIMEFITESDAGMLANAESIICEGNEISLLESEQVTICEGNICVRKFIDDIIAEQFLDIISTGVKFRI